MDKYEKEIEKIEKRYAAKREEIDARHQLRMALIDAKSVKELDGILRNDLVTDSMRRDAERLRPWLRVKPWFKWLFVVGLVGAIACRIAIAVLRSGQS